jgi:quercetin dioxygenase-like cupin family protein
MSSMTRPLTGPHLTFDLEDAIRDLKKDEAFLRSGRVGRTLAKSGPLRLTLVVLAEGVEVGTHHAESPMTLQPLEGRLRYLVDDEEFALAPGQLLFFGPGSAQDIRAMEDTALLLTLTHGGEEDPQP